MFAFSWYGGKYSHLKWLLPLLPPAHHYVEPFGGSAAVLLNRSPSPIETYNDLDGEVVHFFRILREQPGGLIAALKLTPYSRGEFASALLPPGDSPSDLERARRFFVRIGQSFSARHQGIASGDWSCTRGEPRRGMSREVSGWLSQIDGLDRVAQRLLRVQIENLPALDVIQRYDTPRTLFYCDPPYPHESRAEPNKGYAHEMTDEDHRELARILHQIQGRAAVSGYYCPLMEELYGDWQRYDASARKCPAGTSLRQESLWTNYDPASIHGGKQLSLFGEEEWG